MKKFILHWGEMGTRWGINRTVAQIHALLFISPAPLNAEEIAEILSVARSNVSTSLRELQGWGVIRIVHVLGDRRDHFESIKDVWELFRQVMDERKRRECDPTLALLRECVAEAEKGGEHDRHARQKLQELLDFFQTMGAWYEQLRKLPTPALIKFVKIGDKIRKLLGIGGRT
ncbi:MAG TPA: MarR family transcriptional regulator [Tepidisphaeraceae bacterium]|jgi:DNA-binding transcriptional regulator GbsR (MarR family)